MGSTNARWSGLLVLAMVVVRAFVPAGYMLAPLDGELTLVLCDAEMQGAHHPGRHHGHHGMHPDPTCPYAQSAGPAPLPALPVPPPAADFGPALLPAQYSQTFLNFGPVRRQAARAPPQPRPL
jgi:hypothetical protein